MDFCDGASAGCADVKLTSECRTPLPANLCDPAEFCDGVTNDCPPDVLSPAGTVCRASTGFCLIMIAMVFSGSHTALGVATLCYAVAALARAAWRRPEGAVSVEPGRRGT